MVFNLGDVTISVPDDYNPAGIGRLFWQLLRTVASLSARVTELEAIVLTRDQEP